MRKTKESGITLISLIITVIIMLILAGVAINLTIGDNGIFKKTEEAAEVNIRSQLKERLELEITDLQFEKMKNGQLTTKEDIAKRLEEIATIDIVTDKKIEGEYKDYPFEVDENDKVVVGDKLIGAVPTGEIEILTTEIGVEEVEIKVTGQIEDGEIKTIEALNGAELKEDTSNSEKIFKVTENGNFIFRIIGSNGRKAKISCDVTNVILTKADILTAVKETTTSGVQKVRVIGDINTETYSLNVIRHEGNMVLDGTNTFEGSTLANNVYSFGSASDVSTGGYAPNTVVLKVEGDLTINTGVTLTSICSAAGYGGPKGMIVYCTGILTNNGSISMTARGAKAVGQNLYLLKNADGTYETIPAVGGAGGINGRLYGVAGTNRSTGGGGCGDSGSRYADKNFKNRNSRYFLFRRNRWSRSI